MTCKRSKPSNQKPYGLLNPLPVPGMPWESIGVDFVGPLPESKNRDGVFDNITVIICLLTSMVHLVPGRINYNAKQIAELMFEAVYKLHGLPKNIISDRDVLFTSTFWAHLNKLIGTQLKMSSAYHPETDGSTERANRTITQMLRQCIGTKQTDWVSKLPSVEFAINSARSESTGYAPFFLNTGRMPRSMIWNSAPKDEYPSVRNFALQRKLALMAAHDSILGARVKQTRDANKKRRLAPFKEEDLVYISTQNITFPKGLARKLWRSKWVKNVPQLSFECRNYFLMPRNFFSNRRNFWQGPSVSAGSVKTGPSAPAARQCQLIDLCSPPPASAIQFASYMPSWTQKQASN